MNFDQVVEEIKQNFSIISFAISIFNDKELMSKLLVAGIATVSYIQSILATETEEIQDAKMLEMLNDDWYLIDERLHLTKEQDDFVINQLNPTIITYCKFLFNTIRHIPTFGK